MGNDERETCGPVNNCLMCLFWNLEFARNLREVGAYKEVNMYSEKSTVFVLVAVCIHAYKHVYVICHHACLLCPFYYTFPSLVLLFTF